MELSATANAPEPDAHRDAMGRAGCLGIPRTRVSRKAASDRVRELLSGSLDAPNDPSMWHAVNHHHELSALMPDLARGGLTIPRASQRCDIHRLLQSLRPHTTRRRRRTGHPDGDVEANRLLALTRLAGVGPLLSPGSVLVPVPGLLSSTLLRNVGHTSRSSVWHSDTSFPPEPGVGTDQSRRWFSFDVRATGARSQGSKNATPRSISNAVGVVWSIRWRPGR